MACERFKVWFGADVCARRWRCAKGAIDCGLSVAAGMGTCLVQRHTERALGLQGHEFMLVSNRFERTEVIGTSWVSLSFKAKPHARDFGRDRDEIDRRFNTSLRGCSHLCK